MKKKRMVKRDNSKLIDVGKVVKVNPIVLGTLLLCFSVFIFLATVSYNRLDLTVWSSFTELFDGVKKKNILGAVGANVGKAFFEYTFGYTSLIFPVWFFYIGLGLIKPLERRSYYRSFFILFFQLAFIISIAVVLPDSIRTHGHVNDYYPSGLIGGLTSEVLVRMFGKIGSVIILLCYIFCLLFIYYPNLFLRLNIVSFLKKFSIKKVSLPKIILDKSKREKIAEPTLENDTVLELKGKIDENIDVAEKILTERKELGDNTQEERSLIVMYDEEADRFETLDEETASKDVKKEHLEQATPSESYKKKDKNKREDTKKDMPSDKENLEKEMHAIFDRIKTDEVSPENNVPEKEEAHFTREKGIKEKQGNLDQENRKLNKRKRYIFPSVSLLKEVATDETDVSDEELWQSARILEEKLQDFKVDARVVNVVSGPVITMFELKPAMGVRVSKIESLVVDISLSMSARGIRYLGQLPGKDTIGIEIPNANPKMVFFKEIINSEKFVHSSDELPICLGKAVNGEIIIKDLASMPHLLVAGATGSGKSVGLNVIITSLLYSKHPDDLKFVMIDPKMLELGLYNQLENHHLAYSTELNEKVVTDSENAIAILRAVVLEMENRYKKLSKVNVRNIKEYNTKIVGMPLEPEKENSEKYEKLPYIVVIIDELADLMITAGKEIEEPIARLTQMARAVGIHCIIATQRPSVNVITGVIKANIPTRIAFQTASKIDSRTILDLMGAEELLGKGDMLFLPPGQAKAIRIQNAFLETEEIEQVLEHIKKQEFSKRLDLSLVKEEVSSTFGSSRGQGKSNGNIKRDALFEDAKMAVLMSQTASVSYLQRRLGIGYSRAAKIVDLLEDEGIIGPPNNSNRREVLMRLEDLENDKI